MTKTKAIRIAEKVAPSLILLFIGIFMLGLNYKGDNYCFGFYPIIPLVFLGIIYLIIFLSLFIFYSYRMYYQNKSFNFYPIIVTLLLVVYIPIFNPDKEDDFVNNYDRKYISGSDDEDVQLYLKDDEYLLEINYVEATCYQIGNWIQLGDTIKFDENYFGFNEIEILQKYYIISSDKKTLSPIQNSNKNSGEYRLKE